MSKKIHEILNDILFKALAGNSRIVRDAFLYMEPIKRHFGPPSQFAQCSTCMMWTGSKNNICTIHGKDVKVTGDMTCALYVNGKPMPEHAKMAQLFVKPLESGLTKADVRCENCKYVNKKTSECELFKTLNRQLPKLFDLKEKIDLKGCCNAWIKI